MIGKLAISKSGHDKGNLYVIIKEGLADVYLVDGRIKTIEKPKRKNKKHIQVITRFPKEISVLLMKESNAVNLKNEEIKRAIKLYKRSQSECEIGGF
jgi:ribosomal protein L14E/L6E/L27E